MDGSDVPLVERVLSGDRSAFAELYDRYAGLIRAVCYDTTRNLSDAQDLSQEVFLRAYSKLGDLRHPDRFASWLLGIARMVCREWQRRRCRHRHHDVGHVPDAERERKVPSEDDRLGRLGEAMRSLPERERLAMHAFYLNGESADAVRHLLGLSQSGVYRLLDRARERLKGLIEAREEGES